MLLLKVWFVVELKDLTWTILVTNFIGKYLNYFLEGTHCAALYTPRA